MSKVQVRRFKDGVLIGAEVVTVGEAPRDADKEKEQREADKKTTISRKKSRKK